MSMEDSNTSSDPVQCISELTAGATLLKAGRSGKNHFRRFCLTPDLTRLSWESNKRADAAVLISQITQLLRGQKTPNFKRNPLPDCESLSFSLLYSDRSLDIVCKDKREYEIWTTGLDALLKGFNDRDAVNAYIGQQGNQTRTLGDDKIKVALGTLRTKVLVQESACDLYTWGSGVRGMLGHKDEDREKLPRVVESLLGRDMVMAALGVSHTLALSVTGEVYSWGSGIYGQLGHGNLRDRFSPLRIGAPLRGIDITLVACHEYHSAAVADHGELFTWGKAGPHLGYDVKSTKQNSPRRVEFPGPQVKVVQVACGVSHTLVCSEGGKVYSFGTNRFGELGLVHPTPSSMTTPTHISSLTDVAKVACGRYHSAAVDGMGKLWMWGWGARGQLGQANNHDLSLPLAVDGFSDIPVAEISCGDAHNCVLVTTGVVYSWGDNSAGQLGISHNSYTEITKPRQINISTGHSIVQVACGANFSSALSSVGRVFTWGYGASGQLANNELKGRLQAMEVEALLDKQVRMVACGAEHMACTVVHGWVPDEEAKACMACKKSFTTIRRRHHCRKCGGIYCGACTTKRFPLLDRGYSDPVRVCERCYVSLKKIND